jgi:pyruvate/2-oxoglutarate dehydrogenase complex dihydrolipoamide acyltransferase (E2) component
MARVPGYRAVPFTMNRRMVAASASVGRERNVIHGIMEIDVTEPRRLIREHRTRTGEGLSLTAYVVACLARAISEHPGVNAFRRGRKLILLDDITISVLVERDIDGEKVPEPFGVRSAQVKTWRQIHDEIRAAQQRRSAALGDLSDIRWLHLIPGFLLRTFIRAASRSVRMMRRYGAIGVTAVGMFGEGALWFVPLSGATVTVTVGSIVGRPVAADGGIESREHLCLTVSFNHDIVDGAPAARFLKTFGEALKSGRLLAP